MSSRFQLRGDSLEGIEWKLFNTHGSKARIISAERVTEGGIAGLFARHYFEVTVEVPDVPSGQAPRPPAATAPSPPAAASQPASAAPADPPPSPGLTALLQSADDAEAAERPQPRVSTGSQSFDEMLSDLTSNVVEELPAASTNRAVPVPVTGPGKVLLVVGLGSHAVQTARTMGAALSDAVEIRTAGAVRAAGLDHTVGRLGLAAARTAAQLAGRTVLVAFGLRPDGAVPAPALSDLDADQVWLAVDAARKPADTAVWVRKVTWSLGVDALAVLGSQETLTPQTVNELDIPIGWLDGGPATAPEL
ncbi:MAG: hypothetical protein JWO93_2285 [Micrococcaceae bacterium]|nr:hypothetical protein [Micrococcaceae bacterium]